MNLDGKAVANKILDRIKQEVALNGKKPHLAVILVGMILQVKFMLRISRKRRKKSVFFLQ